MCGYLDEATGRFYRWKCLPFGSNASPAIQQGLMVAVKNWLVRTYRTVSAFVFYDDFLVVGHNKQDTEEAMAALLQRLTDIGVKINESKTQRIATDSIEWLGM